MVFSLLADQTLNSLDIVGGAHVEINILLCDWIIVHCWAISSTRCSSWQHPQWEDMRFVVSSNLLLLIHCLLQQLLVVFTVDNANRLFYAQVIPINSCCCLDVHSLFFRNSWRVSVISKRRTPPRISIHLPCEPFNGLPVSLRPALLMKWPGRRCVNHDVVTKISDAFRDGSASSFKVCLMQSEYIHSSMRRSSDHREPLAVQRSVEFSHRQISHYLSSTIRRCWTNKSTQSLPSIVFSSAPDVVDDARFFYLFSYGAVRPAWSSNIGSWERTKNPNRSISIGRSTSVSRLKSAIMATPNPSMDLAMCSAMHFFLNMEVIPILIMMNIGRWEVTKERRCSSMNEILCFRYGRCQSISSGCTWIWTLVGSRTFEQTRGNYGSVWVLHWAERGRWESIVAG